MNDSRSDSRWTRLAQAGDPSAFERIANKYRPRLAALVRDRLGEIARAQVEVDDVLQETFLRAFQALERFEHRGEGSLFRWLAGIAVNVVREEVKKAPKVPAATPRAELVSQAPSQFTALRREDRFDRLQKSLQSLPPDYQEVIRLTRFEKLSPDDVARRMNRSRQAVRNLLLRALRALKVSFGDTESLNLPPRCHGGEK